MTGSLTQAPITHRRTVYGRDLRVGDRFDLDSYVVTEAEIIEFATQWDPQVFHIDPIAAADCHFGEIIASGIHTMGVFQRLVTLRHFDQWNIIAGRGMRELRFPAPVRPDDTLSGRIEIEHIRPARGTGDVVTAAATLQNQHDTVVLTMTMEIQVAHAP